MTLTSTPANGRWSNDEFLDGLRRRGDLLADECFSQLKQTLTQEDFSGLFKILNSNDASIPEDAPQPLRRFFGETTQLPTIDGAPVDAARVTRGESVFMSHAFPAAMVLLVKALPEGYAAPPLSNVLRLSDNLSKRPYRRLLGVLQMVVNVTSVGGFEPAGKAIITVPKMRLLHAGVRAIVRKHLPDYEKVHGVPVNLEDMLGTLMGFSYLVITGLKDLAIELTNEEAEDLYYLWRVFAQMMGIHPESDPGSSSYVPANLAEAAVFYRSYRRRHYVDAADNPDGVVLARANLQMLNDLLPRTPLRRLGLKIVPRIYTEQLIGRAGCARVGIKPVPFLFVTKWLLTRLPWLWTRLWAVVDSYDAADGLHVNVSRMFFQGLIDREFNGEITFHIPDSLQELRELA